MAKNKAAKKTRKTAQKKAAAKAPAKRVTRRRRAAKTQVYHRRTYMLDDETIKESGVIQAGLRASTASEAIRFAIRKTADMMQHVADGAEILVRFKDPKKEAVVLDIPAPGQAA